MLPWVCVSRPSRTWLWMAEACVSWASCVTLLLR